MEKVKEFLGKTVYKGLTVGYTIMIVAGAIIIVPILKRVFNR